MADSARRTSDGGDNAQQEDDAKSSVGDLCADGPALLPASSEGDSDSEEAEGGMDLDTVRSLVEQGANVNAEFEDGETALMIAAWEGRLDTVRYPIEQGADVSVKNGKGMTALMFAAREGDLNTVRCLIKHGANLNEEDGNGWTVLSHAANGGDLDTVRYLVKHGADVNKKDGSGSTVSLSVAWATHLAIVGEQLEEGVDVNAEDEVSERHLEIVRYLVKHGADINTKVEYGSPILTSAASEGQWDIVEYLVQQGADVNAKDKGGSSALMFAATEGHLDTVRFLVQQGADVNAKDKGGSSALMFAATEGHLDTVRFLVQHGADINAKDESGWTAVSRAAKSEHWKTVLYLAKHGGDANVKTKDGRTVLSHATRREKMSTVRNLIELGTDISAKDEDDTTALMSAALQGHLKIVKFLVEQGADVNFVSGGGKSAIRVAAEHGHKDVERFLMQHLATAPSANTKPTSASTSTPDTLPEWLISPFEVTATKFVEAGSIGGDFLATWLDAEVVLKLFVPNANKATFDKEVRMWHQLRHPNVIKLYGACNIGYHFFVCEYASHGSVVEYLSKCEPDARTPWKYLHHAALGLAYLHERGIVHGSLRGSSILLGSDGLAKLADFGLRWSSRKGTTRGLERWQSPEQLKGERASFESDVYALGMCAIEAVTRKKPWKKKWMKSFGHKTETDAGVPADLPEDLVNIVERMCCHSSSRRVSASACARLFEDLANSEHTRAQSVEPAPEPAVVDVSEYQEGEIIKVWDKIQDLAQRQDLSLLHQQLHHDLETIIDRLHQSPQPWKLLKQFYHLLGDMQDALQGSHVNRVLQLSSSRAASGSIYAFQHRVNAIKSVLGIPIDDPKETDAELVQMHNTKQLELFVSETTKTWMVLNELKSDEDRQAFLLFLQSELQNQSGQYTSGQLEIMQQAYNDIRDNVGEVTLPKWFVPWYELPTSEWKTLGEGSFAKVFRAKWLESEVVVKRIDYKSSAKDTAADTKKKREEACSMFMREVGIWFHLSHPHVVRLFGACHVGKPFFVCEYAPNGSLEEYLETHPDEIWQKLLDAALGVMYLHERGVVHCDLKCNNIVVGSDMKAKVTDFGLSSSAGGDDGSDHVTGAFHWVAPELLTAQSAHPTFASDVYAFGMCVVEALRVVEAAQDHSNRDLCKFPWPAPGNKSPLPNAAVKAHKKRGKLPSRPRMCTDAQWELVERMCRFDPSERVQMCTIVDELTFLAKGESAAACSEGSGVERCGEPDKASTVVPPNGMLERGDTCFNSSSMLHEVQKLLWSRIDDVKRQLETNSKSSERLQAFMTDPRTWSTELVGCRDKLVKSTEMALRGYGLHRRLDKIMAAERIVGSSEEDKCGDPGLHDWKSKCCELLGINKAVAVQLLRSSSTPIAGASESAR